MPTKTIAWTTGTGNITLTYTGQGDGTILVSSDDNTGAARSQTITIQTTEGTPVVTRTVTINQAAGVVPEPLTFDILGSGTIGWKANSKNLTRTIQYKKNDGEWTSITSTTSGVTISVASGDVVQFRGDNTAYGNSSSYNAFTATCNFTIRGNIMSLINSSDFVSLTNFTASYALRNLFYGNTYLQNAENMSLPATTLANYCYYQMFSGCTNLTTPPELPATTLANYCYGSMFRDCTSLTTAPELPVTTLVERCYFNMFRDCTSLTAAPKLPATTLAPNCYLQMFFDCTGLTTAPELPATMLAMQCYAYMFRGCTSLTTAPELPATTLTQSCYANMFYGCSRLNYIKCLATDISANNCTQTWVNNVGSGGTFVKASGVTWSTGTSGIPSGWTVEEV